MDPFYVLLDPVEDFLDQLRGDRGASEHTVGAYKSDLLLAIQFLLTKGVKQWAELRPEHVLDWQTHLIGFSISTRQRRLSALRSFTKALKKRGHLQEFVFPDVAPARKPKRLPKALSLEVLESLLAAPDLTTPEGLRDRCLFEILFGGGMRISEAVSLTLAQVNNDTASVMVIGKREKTRWVPLPGQTFEFLERYLRDGRPKLVKKPTDLVLLSNRGLQLRRTTAYLILEHYSKLIGQPETINPHALRHSYAVHLIKGGADLRSVQELLGHESIQTTQIYTELDLADVTDRYKKAHPRA